MVFLLYYFIIGKGVDIMFGNDYNQNNNINNNGNNFQNMNQPNNQMEMPPELGQISYLSNNQIQQVPSMDPLNPLITNQPNVNNNVDPISTYEQTGTTVSYTHLTLQTI